MQKQTKTAIFIFLRNIKIDFTREFLLSLRLGFAKDAKPKFTSAQLVSLPEQIGNPTKYSFLTNAKVIPFKPTRIFNQEQVIEDIFNRIDSPVVKDELHKWFVFGLIGNGRNISDFTSDQLAQFIDELPCLISAIYDYRSFQRKEAENGLL